MILDLPVSVRFPPPSYFPLQLNLSRHFPNEWEGVFVVALIALPSAGPPSNRSSNRYVYTYDIKDMCGLPQAGIFTHNQLVEFLQPFGYIPMSVPSVVWRHKVHTISFTLVVDDFGVKCTKENNSEHILSNLQIQYKVTRDW